MPHHDSALLRSMNQPPLHRATEDFFNTIGPNQTPRNSFWPAIWRISDVKRVIGAASNPQNVMLRTECRLRPRQLLAQREEIRPRIAGEKIETLAQIVDGE